jgi:hypothetical protein
LKNVSHSGGEDYFLEVFTEWQRRSQVENRTSRRPVKLILQIALGIVLGVGLIVAALSFWNRLAHRSTANEYEWQGARHMMDVLVDMPDVSSSRRAEMATETCQNFHINQEDCKQLLGEAYAKADAKAKAEKK